VTVHADPTSDHRTRFEADAIPYMRQMFPAALRLTQERCDAEDLIQETFARAYQKFDQFVPGTNLRGWLYTIMVRTFYGMCRTRTRRPAEVLAADLYESTNGHDSLVTPSRSAEAEALAGVSDSAIMAALSDLPSSFKTVIYLADIEGYQYGDIAEIMGTPLGTVMSRIHRGRQMLRARLLAHKTGTAVVPAQSSRPAYNSAAPDRSAVPDRSAAPDGAAQPSCPQKKAANNPPADPSAVPPRITPPDPGAVPLAA
jgi:RNA polymerase sigma-70 factor, ECF subfamily